VQTSATAAFLKALAAELEAVKQFIDLLKLEQTELSTGTTDALPGLAERKNTLAVHLSGLAAQRNASLAAQGLAADRVGLEAWCAKHPGEKRAARDWATILALAGEARELIRLNGELINTRMQYNSRALEALRGGNSSLDLYGPDGQSTTPGKRRIIDAA
jgi:flagellar biosynthesis protein FlgN